MERKRKRQDREEGRCICKIGRASRYTPTSHLDTEDSPSDQGSTISRRPAPKAGGLASLFPHTAFRIPHPAARMQMAALCAVM